MFGAFQDFTRPIFNWEIAKQPLNWVIVPLIVILGGLALSLIFHPANDCDDSDG